MCSEYSVWQSFYDQRHGNFCKSGYVIRCVCMLYLLFCFTPITPMHVTITVIYFHHVPVMYIARHLDDMSEFPWMSIFWQDILGKSLWYIFDRLCEVKSFKKDNGLAIAFKLNELCTSWYHGREVVFRSSLS